MQHLLAALIALFANTAGVEREDLGTASSFRPSSPAAQRAMDRLQCQCPGCQAKHITISDCACGYAAKQRQEVLLIVAEYDLATGQDAAERAAIDDQRRRYGDQVLAEPASAIAWLFPIAACLGGFGFVWAHGARRRPGRPGGPGRPVARDAVIAEDRELGDQLDDELAELD